MNVLRTEGDHRTGTDVLRELATRDAVPDALPDDGELTDEVDGVASITVEKRIDVTESVRTRKLPRTTYEEQVAARKPYAERYASAPTSFESKTVRFVERGRDTSPCESCSGECRETCPRCDGDREETCRSCCGDATVQCECGDGTTSCPECRGSGSETETVRESCPRCSGSTTIPCSTCHGADDECWDCRGSGTTECPECRGQGTVSESRTSPCTNCQGSGSVQCRRCLGSSTVPCDCQNGITPCPRCSALGWIDCRTCEGDGETVSARTGTLAFEADETVEIDAPVVPPDLFDVSDGDLRETEVAVSNAKPAPGGTTTFRREIEQYEAPFTHYTYEYDGRSYDVTAVDGTLRYDSHPTSKAYLTDEIETKREGGFFEFGYSLTGVDGAVATVAAVAREVGGFYAVPLLTTLSVIPIAVFAEVLTFLGVPHVDYLTGILVILVLFLVAWHVRKSVEGDRYPIVESATDIRAVPHPVWGIGVPLLCGAGVLLLLVGNAPADSKLAVAATFVAVWSGRTACLLRRDASRIDHARRQREKCIQGLDVGRYELEKRGLISLLPDSRSRPTPSQLRTAGTGIVVGTWAMLAWILIEGMPSLANGEPFNLERAFLIIGGLAAVSTLSLGLVAIRRLTTRL